MYGVDRRGDELPEELEYQPVTPGEDPGGEGASASGASEADKKRGRHEDDDGKPTGRGRRYKWDFGVPED